MFGNCNFLALCFLQSTIRENTTMINNSNRLVTLRVILAIKTELNRCFKGGEKIFCYFSFPLPPGGAKNLPVGLARFCHVITDSFAIIDTDLIKGQCFHYKAGPSSFGDATGSLEDFQVIKITFCFFNVTTVYVLLVVFSAISHKMNILLLRNNGYRILRTILMYCCMLITC